MDTRSALYRGVGRLRRQRNDVDGRDTNATDDFDSHDNIESDDEPADQLDHCRDVGTADHAGSSGDPA